MPEEAQARILRASDDDFRIDALLRWRARPAAAVILEIHDPDPAARRQRLRQVSQEWYGILHLVECIHDEDGVEASRGQPGIGRGAENRLDVAETLAVLAAFDRLDHLRLDVFRIHEAIGPHASGESNGKPAGTGAEVGHGAAVGDAERIHDLIGLLPRVPVWPFEAPEVLRRKETPVLAPFLGEAIDAGDQDEVAERQQECVKKPTGFGLRASGFGKRLPNLHPEA